MQRVLGGGKSGLWVGLAALSSGAGEPLCPCARFLPLPGRPPAPGHPPRRGPSPHVPPAVPAWSVCLSAPRPHRPGTKSALMWAGGRPVASWPAPSIALLCASPGMPTPCPRCQASRAGGVLSTSWGFDVGVLVLLDTDGAGGGARWGGAVSPSGTQLTAAPLGEKQPSPAPGRGEGRVG